MRRLIRSLMKSIIAAVILISPSSAFAQVVSVNVFQPVSGGAQLTAEYFQEAKAIMQAAGAQVTTSSDLKGAFRFATIFDNWEAYLKPLKKDSGFDFLNMSVKWIHQKICSSNDHDD